MDNFLKKSLILVSISLALFSCHFVYAETLAEEIPITTETTMEEVPVVSSTTIHLEISSGETYLYDADIVVEPCDSDNNPATVDVVTPYCAIGQLQSEVTSNWSWSDSFGYYINSIGDISGSTTQDENGNDVYHYWSWYLNGGYASVGLSQYELQANDLISLTFVNPIKEETLIPSTVIHLEIFSGENYLYDSDIAVEPCDSDNDPATENIITPYCALVQSGVLSDWSGLWINSIGGFSNNFTDNLYWMWLANLNIDNISPNSSYNLSAKQYEVSPDDRILFYYNTNPLDISVNNLTPALNDVLTIKIKELGLDSSWNPIWAPSLLSKVVIGSNVFNVDENGEYKINILSTDPFTILGQKDGFINSPSVVITPVVSNQGGNDDEEEDNNNNGGSSGGSIEKNFSVENAVSFLSANYDDSIDSLYADWLAIGIAKSDGASSLKKRLSVYLKNGPFESSSVTDYERHAMALMALDISPYDGTDINYIDEIVDSFDGKQIGDDSLYNDDIFALIVLSNAGYSKKDEMIEKIVSYVISKQSSSGSWGSVDMTAAAIEALSNFESLDGVEDAISKGESYLVGKQKADGSFENVFSTSWAIQALSLDSTFNDEVDKAIKYLISNQQADGGVTDDSDIKSRIWATSYTLPAVLKLSWSNILESFSKEENEESDSSGDNEEKVSEEENKEAIVLINEVKTTDIPKIEIKQVKPKVEIKAIQNIALDDIEGQQSDRENLDSNLLGASVLDSGQINDNGHFLSFIFKVFDIIKTLFNRLLVVLHI